MGIGTKTIVLKGDDYPQYMLYANNATANNKTVIPISGDAGDLVTYSVTFTADSPPANANAVDAFDMRLVDSLGTLPGTPLTNLAISLPPSFSAACLAPTVTNNSTLTTVDLIFDRIRTGCTVTLTYTAQLAGSVTPGQVITNSANLTYTSLPGPNGTTINPTGSSTLAFGAPRGNSGGLNGERDGSGGAINTYFGSDTASVNVFSTPEKTIIDTSESSTGLVGGIQRVAIGEIVRYRMTYQLAEGMAPNLRFVDNLPVGLQFLNDGTTKVAFVSNGAGITSSTLSGAGLQVSGNEATVGSIRPTFVLPPGAISGGPFGSGTDPTFSLGNVTNDDRDIDQEFVVLELNALVLNEIGNQSTSPGLVNSYQILVGSSTLSGSAATVNIAEPVLTLSKAVVPAAPPLDAGDVVAYTLTATNTASGDNAAAAFDLAIADTLDTNLEIQSLGGSTTGGACGVTPSTFSSSFSGQTITAAATCLNPGGVMTITVSPNGTTPNTTESTTPGGTGTAAGERDGVHLIPGDPNDYAASAPASTTLTAPSISKQAPVPAQQTIGGTVDYDLLVTLPEGATINLRVRDALPAGLGYVSHSVITSGAPLPADYNGTLTSTPTCPACVVGASGVTLEFQFGDVQTNGSGPANGSARNQFVVRVRARVLNVAGNQNGTLLANAASLVYVNPQTGDAIVAGGVRTLTVTEPELQLAKVVDDPTPGFGQPITYRITVSHAGGSTADAFDLSLSDTVMPPGLTYVAGSLANVSGVPAVLDASGAPTLRASWTTLALGQSSVISYQVTVGGPGSVDIGDILSNDVDLSWTSLSGSSGDERTGAGGVDDYRTTTTAPVTVTGPDLQVSKDDGRLSASPGNTLTYTVTVYNDGNATAPNVLLTDTLPSNTAFISASNGGSESSPGVVTWPTFNLAAATSVFRTVTVRVNNPLPSGVESLTNTAEAHDDGSVGPDPTPGNNTATDVDTVDAAPDLVIAKTDMLSIISPGETLTYVLTYSNAGDQDASGVVISETVPAGTTFVSPTGWSCAPGSPAGTACTYTIGDLAAGVGGTVNFVVVVNDPPLVSSVVNTSTIADNGANGPDQNPADNTATDTDNLVTLPDYDLTKELSATSQTHTTGLQAAIGEILTYRVVMTIPVGTMPSAVLTDVLDRGLAFVECLSLTSSSGLTTTGDFAAACSSPGVAEEPAGSGNAEDQGRRVTFNLGTMTNAGPGDATLTLLYSAVAIDNAGNVRGVNLNNGVTWTWVGGQLVENAQEVTLVEPTLTLSKTAAPMSAPPGAPITFTLTIEQDASSDSAAFDLRLVDVVPVGLTYVPGSLAAISGPTAVSDESGAPTLIVTWDDFGLGETATVQFQATMGNLGPGDGVTNMARLEWTSLPDNPPASLNLSLHNTLAAERRYDPATGVDLYGVTADVTVRVPRLPETGFAPGRVTQLEGQSHLADVGDLTLEIPALGISIPIVGIPAEEAGWDLTWLGAQAGYLEGTAYPTHRGNSALTAHVTLPNGRPGPFAELADLRWGDRVVVHAYGLRYVYKVRTIARVNGGDLRSLGHKDQAWLTLITCRTYDEATGKYLHRIAVQAVLIEVAEE
ncbi:MAG: sortase [Chloroflexi bacterium]|nr:sortase [Chloroflexota bacterium]